MTTFTEDIASETAEEGSETPIPPPGVEPEPGETPPEIIARD